MRSPRSDGNQLIIGRTQLFHVEHWGWHMSIGTVGNQGNHTALGLSAQLPHPYGTILVFPVFEEHLPHPCQPHHP